ncbi:MAG: acyltransferase [Actinomycetota bacterium]
MAERERHLAHIPALDGIRGLAVVAVLFFHGGFSWAVGGWLGVSLFFTLSGYLIASVTIVEFQAEGRVSLRGFWERRLRRLLPAALVTLTGVSLLSRWLVFDNQLDALRGDIIAALFYVANWRFWERGESYADVFGAPSPVVHFWSLSIEEQFYFVFPVIAVVALATGGLRRLGIVIGLLAVSSLAAALLITGADRSYFGTDTRAFEILLGVLVAIWHRAPRTEHAMVERAVTWMAWPAWIIAVIAVNTISTSDPRVSSWLLPAFAVLSVVVILAATVRERPLSRALANPVFTGLGTLSYGIYLYHWPIFGLLTAQRVGFGGWSLFGLRIAVTLVVAAVSYVLIEAPVRRRRALVTPRQLGVGLSAGAALAAMLAFAIVRTPAAEPVDLTIAAAVPTTSTVPTTTSEPAAADDADAESEDEDEPDPAPADTTPPPPPPPTFERPVRILAVGDSTARSAGEGLEAWGLASGDAEISIIDAPGCGVIDENKFRHQADDVGGAIVPDYCRNWVEQWTTRIEGFQPDIITVFYGPFDTVDRDVDLDDDWESPGEPSHDAVYAADFAKKIDVLAASEIPVVWMAPPYVWADSPRGSGNRSLTTLPDRVDELTNLLTTLTEADDRVRLAPYGRLVDGGEQEVDFDQRYDGIHFSDGVAAALARDGMFAMILDEAAALLVAQAEP